MNSLVVLGGGEHARVVLDAALSRGGDWRVLGLGDRGACEETVQRFRVPHLGDLPEALAYAVERGAMVVLAVGAVSVSPLRREIVVRLGIADERAARIVHSHAWVSPSATVGAGAVVFAGAVLNSGATVGAHAIINTGAILEHDVSVGPYALVAPGVTIGGGARIGESAYVGLGAKIRDHVTIGAGATVGMGAVVVRDVQPGTVVIGVPARPA